MPTDPSAGAAPNDAEEPRAVRPYAVTGGRTRPSGDALPLEALVTTGGPAPARLEPEKRRIAELTSGAFLSIAEVSAHVRLPVGVVRVLVGDLIEDGVVRVAGADASASGSRSATLSVLESVLNGISAL